MSNSKLIVDDFMARINQEEGDAFPYEKARIIAELEQSMSQEELGRKDYFPKWLHVLMAKNNNVSVILGILLSCSVFARMAPSIENGMVRSLLSGR